MQTFNTEYKHEKTYSAFSISSILIILALASAWIFQKSINDYYYITYNKTSPLERLNEYPVWKKGADFYAVISNLLTNKNSEEEIVIPPMDDAPLSLTSLNNSQTLSLTSIENTDLAQQAAGQLKQKGARDLSTMPEAQKAKIKTVSAQEAERVIKDNQLIIATANDKSLRDELELTRTPLSFDNSFANENNSQGIVLESLKGTDSTDSADNADYKRSYSRDNSENLANQWGWEEGNFSAQEPSNSFSSFEEAPQVKATKSSNGGSAALSSGKSVYLVGDSMMQGVAPFLQQWLSKSGYKSINQAKPSSGLVQNTVKNWPAEIESTLAQNPNISLMVMFIGQNDTLNFVSNKKVVGFQSPQWENLYSSKMNQILSSAERRGVKVIWIGIPPMRSEKYERKMSYLDNLMRKNMRNRGIYIPTRNLVSDNGRYADIKNVNGKQVKVRNKDGIHLSFDGYKLVANEVKKHINIR